MYDANSFLSVNNDRNEYHTKEYVGERIQCHNILAKNSTGRIPPKRWVRQYNVSVEKVNLNQYDVQRT